MSMPMATPAYDNQSEMDMGMEMDMMHTSFFWGKDTVVLFSGWPGSGRLGMYILALLLIFVLAAASEIFSLAPPLKPRSVHPAAGAAIHAAVYTIRTALAYLVMLAVMSFNVGIFLAAVAGHATGSFAVKFQLLAAAAAEGLDDS